MMVTLRPWREDDIDDCVEACNDPAIQQFLPMLPFPYTRAHALELFSSAGRHLAIADTATGRLLGAISLTEGGTAVGAIDYWVAPWARRQGVARSALEAFSAELFQEGYQRLTLQTELANGAAQRVAIAAGFRREGIARWAGRGGRDGRPCDMVVWGRVADDRPGPGRRVLPDLPGGRLTDGTIVVRPLVPGDAADMRTNQTSSVPPDMPLPPLARFERICAEAEAEWLAGERAAMTIRMAADDAYAGEINLFDVDTFLEEVQIGSRILPDFRGRGIGTRATQLVAAWALTTGMHRVYGRSFADNLTSHRCLEASGFEREGLHVEQFPGIRGGPRMDAVQFAKRAPAGA